MVMDTGWPTSFCESMLAQYGEYLDVVKLWDPQTGRLLDTFRSHTGVITRVAFLQLPEGLRLISANRDGTVKFWNVAKLSMPKDTSIQEPQP